MNLPPRLKKFNLYHLLKVENFSAPEEVKRGFRKLVLKYHPDRFPTADDAAHKFSLVSEAYNFLKVPENRLAYNQMLSSLKGSGSVFRNEEFAKQRQKTSNSIYSQRAPVDSDFDRFVDECRNNFNVFMKHSFRIPRRPSFYSRKTMEEEEFNGFLEEGRNKFQEFLRGIPRVKSSNG